MTATPAKFTFDLDMSVRREKSSMVSDTERRQLQDAARQEGFIEGEKAGTNSAEAAAQRAFQVAAENLAQQATLLLSGIDRAQRDAIDHATTIGVTIGKKLSSQLVDRFPEAELEALIADSIRSLEDAPHLVIRCHPDLSEPIKAIADEHVTASGFSGRLLVMGEPEIAMGDGRLEWADGGLVRDSTAICDAIEKAVSAWLDARTPPVPQGEQK